MGLDMYLYKKTFVGANYDHTKTKGRVEITQEGKRVPIKLKRISEITEQVGYWRKANAIHKWFVDNVQEGNDDCREYEVTLEQLQDLLACCKKVKESSTLVKGKIKNGYTFENGKEKPIIEEGQVIEDPTVAQELLPSQSGFFFGGTDYDQYYLQDIDLTIEILQPVIKEMKADKKAKRWGSVVYQSSW